MKRATLSLLNLVNTSTYSLSSLVTKEDYEWARLVQVKITDDYYWIYCYKFSLYFDIYEDPYPCPNEIVRLPLDKTFSIEGFTYYLGGDSVKEIKKGLSSSQAKVINKSLSLPTLHKEIVPSVLRGMKSKDDVEAELKKDAQAFSHPFNHWTELAFFVTLIIGILLIIVVLCWIGCYYCRIKPFPRLNYVIDENVGSARTIGRGRTTSEEGDALSLYDNIQPPHPTPTCGTKFRRAIGLIPKSPPPPLPRV